MQIMDALVGPVSRVVQFDREIRKALAFLWKTFFAKKFQVREKILIE
jgi:hypothetical protein